MTLKIETGYEIQETLRAGIRDENSLAGSGSAYFNWWCDAG